MQISIEGKSYSVRGLTRRELFALKAQGFSFEDVFNKVGESESGMTEILEKGVAGLTREAALEMLPCEANPLLVLISKLTFMGETDAKNFLRSLTTGLPGGSVDATDAKPEGPAVENAEA